MKILYVTHGFPPEKLGGVELHTAELARSVSRRHEVTVLVPTDEPSIEPFRHQTEEREGHRLVRLRAKRSGLRFEAVYWNPKLDHAFDRLLDDLRPDVVHVHSLIHLSFGVLDVLRARRIPTVMTLHDFFSVCPLGQRIRRDLDLCIDLDRARCEECLKPKLESAFEGPWTGWPVAAARTLAARAIKAPSEARLGAHDERMRETLRSVDLLVTPSAFHRDRFLEYGIEHDRIRVVENGLVPFRPRPPKPDPEGRIRFGYVGLVIPTKGVHIAVDAMRLVQSRNVSLEIHGNAVAHFGRTDYLDDLKSRAPEDPPVRFHGRFAGGELPDRLAGLDALIVPSLWYETFCLTAREAFLAGVPVIASRLGALQEAFREGEGGLFFEAGNALELACAMDRLAGDPALRERLRKTIPSVRTMEACADEMMDVYDAVTT